MKQFEAARRYVAGQGVVVGGRCACAFDRVGCVYFGLYEDDEGNICAVVRLDGHAEDHMVLRHYSWLGRYT